MPNPYQSPAESLQLPLSPEVAPPVTFRARWVALLGVAPWVLFYFATDCAVWGYCGNSTLAEMQEMEFRNGLSRVLVLSSAASAVGLAVLSYLVRSPWGLAINLGLLGWMVIYAALQLAHGYVIWP